MEVCAAHEIAWQSEKRLWPGEGYLLASSFMQWSVIQNLLIDQGISLVQDSGFTRDQCRQQVESIQGSGPWLICEECISVVELSETDSQAARDAAVIWWKDRSAPGYMPRTSPTSEKEPTNSADAIARERVLVLAWVGLVLSAAFPLVGTPLCLFVAFTTNDALAKRRAHIGLAISAFWLLFICGIPAYYLVLQRQFV